MSSDYPLLEPGSAIAVPTATATNINDAVERLLDPANAVHFFAFAESEQGQSIELYNMLEEYVRRNALGVHFNCGIDWIAWEPKHPFVGSGWQSSQHQPGWYKKWARANQKPIGKQKKGESVWLR